MYMFLTGARSTGASQNAALLGGEASIFALRFTKTALQNGQE